MKEFVEKLQSVEVEASKLRGPFRLFALFLREGSQVQWDLLVSAPWIDNDPKALEYIAPRVQAVASKEEMRMLSRIVIITESDPALERLQRILKVEHNWGELKNINAFGFVIPHAFIITCQRV